MTMERFLLIAMVAATICSALYIPKGQLRKALLSFISFQATTWFVSLVLKQTGSVEFPVREFVKATQIAFIVEFFFYPTFFVWFIFLYPAKVGLVCKLLHWIVFISATSWSAYYLGKYTDLSEFAKGSSFLHIFNTYWIFTLQYLLCYKYIKWFYKESHRE